MNESALLLSLQTDGEYSLLLQALSISLSLRLGLIEKRKGEI
jgi:hypothetical protein